MSFQNQFTKTTTDANLMETVHHGSAEYPFRYYYENIALFDFKCIDWHWHSELEFIYIESGNVVFDIGTVHFELNEGNGIMINSNDYSPQAMPSFPIFCFSLHLLHHRTVSFIKNISIL